MSTYPQVADKPVACTHKDATFKLRVPTSDLASWRECAEKSGLPLAEWIRRRCNGEGHLIAEESETDFMSRVAALGEPVLPPHHGKTCPHGKARGYNCGLCGGMAEVS